MFTYYLFTNKYLMQLLAPPIIVKIDESGGGHGGGHGGGGHGPGPARTFPFILKSQACT